MNCTADGSPWSSYSHLVTKNCCVFIFFSAEMLHPSAAGQGAGYFLPLPRTKNALQTINVFCFSFEKVFYFHPLPNFWPPKKSNLRENDFNPGTKTVTMQPVATATSHTGRGLVKVVQVNTAFTREETAPKCVLQSFAYVCSWEKITMSASLLRLFITLRLLAQQMVKLLSEGGKLDVLGNCQEPEDKIKNIYLRVQVNKWKFTPYFKH